MKRLIVVRHGDYTLGSGYHLSELGKEQIEKLSGLLQPVIGGESVVILTSPANRAKESAAILGKHLGVTPEEHDVLCPDIMRPDFDAVLALIDTASANGVDNVVIVTHNEYQRFYDFFVALRLHAALPDVGFNNGEAWVVDCGAKNIVPLR